MSEMVEVKTTIEPSSEAREEIEADAEAIETISSDAVEIARIEADRDVTIAAIEGENRTAEIEHRTEVELAAHERKDEEWREILMNMQEQIASLQMMVGEIRASSIPPASPPEPMAMDLIPPSTSHETSEMPTEVLRESVEEKAEVETEAPKRKRRRAI